MLLKIEKLYISNYIKPIINLIGKKRLVTPELDRKIYERHFI